VAKPKKMENESIVTALMDVLEQERMLLVKLSPEVYTAAGKGPFKSSIGAHIRHNLDHFTSFFAGLSEGRVDYEKRRRDDGIACSTEHALADIERHLLALRAIPSESDTGTLLVREESDSATDKLRWLESSVGRELQFLLGHTVHHHAIIALLLAQQGVDLPEGFGVAPSTQRHERKAAEASR